MSAPEEITWDTEEAALWFGTAEAFYDAGRATSTDAQLRAVFEEFYPADDFHESQRVDPDAVDWQAVRKDLNDDD